LFYLPPPPLSQRHETTGLPGQIHVSKTTQSELTKTAKGKFVLQKRGRVAMKGKGKLETFWCEPSESNSLVNQRTLKLLREEVQEMLNSATSFDADVEKMLNHEETRQSFMKASSNSDSQSCALALPKATCPNSSFSEPSVNRCPNSKRLPPRKNSTVTCSTTSEDELSIDSIDSLPESDLEMYFI
jgi:hypothetical protein